MRISRVIIVAFPLASFVFLSSACTSSRYGTESTTALEIEGEQAEARLWRLHRAGQAQGSVDYRIGESYADVWMGAGKTKNGERVVERYIYYSIGASHVDWSQGTYEIPEPGESTESTSQVTAESRQSRRPF